jgi:hypothetical protein
MDGIGDGLLPGERVLWTGRPSRARVLRGDLALPGLLLAALLATVIRWGRGGPVGMAGQVVFVLAGIAFLVAAAIWALRVKPDALRRTAYQVTDRRVVLATGPRHVWAAYLDQLAEPVAVRQPDGTADLMLRGKEKFSLASLNSGQHLLAGYPAIGRLLLRRARIGRCTYILTSQRLVADWATGRRPAGTECALARLLPPEVRNGSIFMRLAWPPRGRPRNSWADLLWPAAANDPPQLIGLPDPQAVAQLICAAQLAERARTWAAAGMSQGRPAQLRSGDGRYRG